MLSAGVFQLGDDLNGEMGGASGFEELEERRVVQSVVVEPWVESQGFHAVVLLAPFEVVTPTWLSGAEGANGQEQIGGCAGAVGSDACVDRGQVLLEERIIAANPSLSDAMGTQVGGQCFWSVVS